ncbi:MAG: DUF559 domain-containing protein [Candidatus Micrarchaeota archaeon]
MEKISLPRKLLSEMYFGKKLSLREISWKLKIDLKTLLRIFRDLNIRRRSYREAWKIRRERSMPRSLAVELMARYFDEDFSLKKLSSLYGISRKNLSRSFKRMGVTLRKKGFFLSGRCKTPMHRKNISAGRKRMLEKSPKLIESLRFHRLMQILPTKDTSIERLIEQELANREIGHYKHYSIMGMCQADKAFPDCKLAVFCDGDYWHKRVDIAAKDERINNLLRNNGWTVQRYWEADIKRDPVAIVDDITAKLCDLRGVAYGFKAPKVE